MRFEECHVAGAYVVEPEPRADERGSFARVWCEQEFLDHGIDFRPLQANVGSSKRTGTMRGIHFQIAPDLEAKFVRCTRGAIFDVAVDLRPGSPSAGRWFGTELSAQNGKMLFIPEGCGHGCVTLQDDTEIYYLTSSFYAPQSARGIRYDDPAIGVQWPIAVTSLSDQDRNWPAWTGRL